MPAVENATADEPVKLERVEVRPGVVLKLSPKDAQAYADRMAAEAADRAAYQALVAGGSAEQQPATNAEPSLMVLTKAELAMIAEGRGLATSGSKPAIAARIAGGTDDASASGGTDTAPAGGTDDAGAAAGAPAGAAPDATTSTTA